MFKKLGYLFVVLINITGGQCLGENCTQNLDCTVQNSVCVEKKCVCDKMSTEHESECLPLAITYKGICQITDQCQWLGGNSECTKSRCVCKKNYRWFQGECRRYVNKGEKCGPQVDCYNGYDYLSLKCDDKKKICICNDGYYDRGLDCRLISKEGSACAIDLDCQDNNLTCTNGAKCVQKTQPRIDLETVYIIPQIKDAPSGEIIKIKDEPVSCYFDEDCGKIGNSQCDVKKAVCRCLPDTYFYQDNCVPGLGPCTKDSDCTKSNTMCFNDNSCVCKRGYYMDDGECHPELGVKDFSLQSKANCLIKPASFQDNTCYCLNYWYNDDSNQNCIKPMAQQYMNCPVNSESCNVMGLYSYCNNTSHKCSCNEYSKLNMDNFICEKTAKLPEDACLRDDDCKLNEICKVNKCECIPKFSKDENGNCLPDIGGSCEVSSCSHIKNAKCAGGTCYCATNTSYVETAKKCLKAADHINDVCEDIAQCQRFENTVCDIPETQNDTVKRCICQSDYLEVESACLKKKAHGDPCMTSKDCTLVLNNSFQCRKSICQCPVYYKLKNDYCQRAGSLSLIPEKWIVYVAVLTTILKAFSDGN